MKKESLKLVCVIILLLWEFSSFAQQDPLFTQYMYNKLLVNPAYAGSKEALSIDLLNRAQWVGIEGAPQTLTLGAHLAMKNRKVGLGLYGYRDALGPSVNQGIMATYAYRLLLGENTLSFGIQGGIKHFGFNWDQIKTKYPDSYFYPGEAQKITPDANLGVYFQSPSFFAGLSSKQLLENEYGRVTNAEGENTFTRLLRHFYLMAGTVFPVSEKIAIKPSMLVKYVKNAPVQADLNASIDFNQIFWVGISFRTQRALALLTEFRITPSIRLGYSCDIYLNELQPFNYGSHEIRLGFDLQVFDSRMVTPRYFR